MSEGDSTASRATGKPAKPNKPYPDFPLPAGVWCKKIRVQLWLRQLRPRQPASVRLQPRHGHYRLPASGNRHASPLRPTLDQGARAADNGQDTGNAAPKVSVNALVSMATDSSNVATTPKGVSVVVNGDRCEGGVGRELA